MPVATDRRLFLKYLGAGMAGTVASAVNPLGPLAGALGAMPFQPASAEAADSAFLSFAPILPSDRDELLLPSGFRYQTVIAYNDRFTLNHSDEDLEERRAAHAGERPRAIDRHDQRTVHERPGH